MFTGNYRVIRGGFLQYLQGKPATSAGISLQSVNITGFSLQILQKKPLNHPVNSCKHLQCRLFAKYLIIETSEPDSNCLKCINVKYPSTLVLLLDYDASP